MSYNTCASAQEEVSDNKHAKCPAKMSDGRLFTSYNSRCAILASVLPHNLGSMSAKGLDSYDTRQYMIHNADSIIRSQRDIATCAARCLPCGKDTMLPEAQIDSCDKVKCVRRPSGATDGLGTGRDYGQSTGSHGEAPGAFTVYSGGRALRPIGGGVDAPWT